MNLEREHPDFENVKQEILLCDDFWKVHLWDLICHKLRQKLKQQRRDYLLYLKLFIVFLKQFDGYKPQIMDPTIQ